MQFQVVGVEVYLTLLDVETSHYSNRNQLLGMFKLVEMNRRIVRGVLKLVSISQGTNQDQVFKRTQLIQCLSGKISDHLLKRK